MLRFGNITEVDPAKGYARVTFTDDGIVSDWLQICVMGAISDKYTHTFEVKEQVACLMDENSEEGVILGALFNNAVNPSGGAKGVLRVKFSDNSVIEYNRNTHEYNLDIKGKINISAESDINIITESNVNIDSININVNASGNVDLTATGNVDLTASGNANITASAIAKIEAPIIQLNGIVTTSGAVAVGGAITIGGTVTSPGGGAISGNIEVTGKLIAASDVEVGEISLKLHKHPGVTSGTDYTQPPV